MVSEAELAALRAKLAAYEQAASTDDTLAVMLNAPSASREAAGIPRAPLKLDLGCGTRKREGFTGVDSRQFPGVDVVADLTGKWPWADDTVDEVEASHVLEHFEPAQRIHFVNELFRVLKPGGKALITTPHWCSGRAYGDLTHKWPPVAEMWFSYLNAEWRRVNAPHNDVYTCDFDVPTNTMGYNVHPSLTGRNHDYVANATTWWREAAQDLVVTIVKPVKRG